MKVDLITGFLGAGKTTLIHKYIGYLNRQGEKVRVIENDLLPVSVDAGILSEDPCEVVDMSGTCMRCGGNAKFRSMLIRGARDNCDRILVESTGLYDVNEFFETMETEEVRACCETGSILTVLDPRADAAFSGDAGYLTFTQLFSAGQIILSKTETAGEKAAEKILKAAGDLLRAHGCSGPDEKTICRKPWDQLTDQDFEKFSRCGYHVPDYRPEFRRHDQSFETRETADLCENGRDLEERIRRLMTDPVFGTVLRVKGYIQDLDRNWYEAEGCADGVSVRPCGKRRGICGIAGQGLRDEALKQAFLPRREIKERQNV